MLRKLTDNLILILSLLVMVGVAKGDIVNEFNSSANPAPQPVACLGCVCDGVTDTTAAINAALIIAANNTLQLPAGTCEVGELIPSNGTTIQGMGRQATILQLDQDIGQSGDPTGIFHLALSQHDIVFKNFTIDGKNQTFADTNNEGIFISNRSTGGGSYNITVDNVEIENTGGAGWAAIGPTFGTTPVTPIHHNLTVQNSYIHNTGYHGLISQGYVNYVTFLNNYVTLWGGLVADSAGITCGRYGTGCLVANNYVPAGTPAASGGSAHCISLDGGFNIQAINNVDGGCTGFGIEIGFVTNSTVANNTISDNLRAGIAYDTGLPSGGTAQTTTDVTTTASSPTITSASAMWYQAMTGRTVTLSGCGSGGATLVSTIVQVAGTRGTITLRDNCQANQTGTATLTLGSSTQNIAITGNTLRNTDTLGNTGAIQNNVGTQNLNPYTAADFTCTNGSTTISSPTIKFVPYMVGAGIVLTGCGVASADLATTIVSETNPTTATIATAASTSVVGTSTGSIASDFDRSSGVAITGNSINKSAGTGILANQTDLLNITGNVINGAALSGIFIQGSNHIQLGGNAVTFSNSTNTANNSGIFVNMQSSVGTAFNMTGPNAAIGNSAGGGGSDDQIYEQDGSSAVLANFPGVVAGGMIPNMNGATFGNSSAAFNIVNACSGTGAVGTPVSDTCISTSSKCFCNDTTAANAIKCVATTSTLTATGTGTDGFTWGCF